MRFSAGLWGRVCCCFLFCPVVKFELGQSVPHRLGRILTCLPIGRTEITLTYEITVYKSVYFTLSSVKTILKSPDNCTKAKCGMSGLTARRRVVAAFCLNRLQSVRRLPARTQSDFIERPDRSCRRDPVTLTLFCTAHANGHITHVKPLSNPVAWTIQQVMQ